MRYRPGLPLVLRSVNMHINKGTSLGIVGRSGGGKSSLLFALFRLIDKDLNILDSKIASELNMNEYHTSNLLLSSSKKNNNIDLTSVIVNDNNDQQQQQQEEDQQQQQQNWCIDQKSRILFNGINIYDMSLSDLRSMLTVVPQQPTLFSGSLRFNLTLQVHSNVSDDRIWVSITFS